jgi:hypothetical protein
MASIQPGPTNKRLPKQNRGVWEYKEIAAWLDDSAKPIAGAAWHAMGEQMIFLIGLTYLKFVLHHLC